MSLYQLMGEEPRRDHRGQKIFESPEARAWRCYGPLWRLRPAARRDVRIWRQRCEELAVGNRRSVQL